MSQELVLAAGWVQLVGLTSSSDCPLLSTTPVHQQPSQARLIPQVRNARKRSSDDDQRPRYPAHSPVDAREAQGCLHRRSKMGA